MFYIYHIPNVKIGCTTNIKKRVVKQQGYNNYEILYKTKDINKASKKELELQTKYEYKKDNKTYKEVIMNIKNKFYVTKQSITFNNTDEDLKDFEFPEYIVLDNNKILFTKELKQWCRNNNTKSMHNEKRYVYRKGFEKEYNNLKEKNLFDKIRIWAKNKGILDKGDSKTQYIKLQEEAGELAKALLNKDKPEIIDAIGDIVVVLTNLAKLEKLNIEDCIESAYNVINKRKGKMINGTFVKNK